MSIAGLEKGNVVRLERVRVRREIAALTYIEGLEVARQAVALPPPHCDGMPVEQLLRAVRHFGPERARMTLSRARVSPRATLGSLTPRQREAIRSQLERP